MLDFFIDIIADFFIVFFLVAAFVFAFSIVAFFLSMLGFHQFDGFWNFFGQGDDDSYGG